ncbi:hypothetical protein Pst134EA_024107 [Puccinia striiformis f. sp. tritici]|uniref:hypothetical protein n=1 Tax=Puccinia striiformis f. sp. tritici TaxID=168172 RepID=UPI00200785E0|nr:hypothetical protein Pst134EA_024107 [Puccinia striiformis f. sp. tritici]KAH9453223.1 hypothetical protein Pst134EA_024107 [Puccinia striiformis f. sp. tritici]
MGIGRTHPISKASALPLGHASAAAAGCAAVPYRPGADNLRCTLGLSNNEDEILSSALSLEFERQTLGVNGVLDSPRNTRRTFDQHSSKRDATVLMGSTKIQNRAVNHLVTLMRDPPNSQAMNPLTLSKRPPVCRRRVEVKHLLTLSPILREVNIQLADHQLPE